MAWILPGDFAWAFGDTGSGGGGGGTVDAINAILPLRWDAGTEVLTCDPASALQSGYVSMGAQTLGTGRKTVAGLTSNASIELVGAGTSTLSQVAGSLNIVSSGSAIETSSRFHTTNVAVDAVEVVGGVVAASLRLGAVGQPVISVVDDDVTMAADSSTRLPTQHAVKTYIASAPAYLISPVTIDGNVYTDATLQSLSNDQWSFNKRWRATSLITGTSLGEFDELGGNARVYSATNLILSPVLELQTAAPYISTNATAATSNSTGAIVATGGIGCGGNVFCNNTLVSATVYTRVPFDLKGAANDVSTAATSTAYNNWICWQFAGNVSQAGIGAFTLPRNWKAGTAVSLYWWECSTGAPGGLSVTWRVNAASTGDNENWVGKGAEIYNQSIAVPTGFGRLYLRGPATLTPSAANKMINYTLTREGGLDGDNTNHMYLDGYIEVQIDRLAN